MLADSLTCYLAPTRVTRGIIDSRLCVAESFRFDISRKYYDAVEMGIAKSVNTVVFNTNQDRLGMPKPPDLQPLHLSG